jgi:hypothetical protein
MNVLHAVLTRLKEPSTYAGMSALALAVGISVETFEAVSAAVAGVAGLLAMVLHEKAKPE